MQEELEYLKSLLSSIPEEYDKSYILDLLSIKQNSLNNWNDTIKKILKKVQRERDYELIEKIENAVERCLSNVVFKIKNLSPRDIDTEVIPLVMEFGIPMIKWLCTRANNKLVFDFIVLQEEKNKEIHDKIKNHDKLLELLLKAEKNSDKYKTKMQEAIEQKNKIKENFENIKKDNKNMTNEFNNLKNKIIDLENKNTVLENKNRIYENEIDGYKNLIKSKDFDLKNLKQDFNVFKELSSQEKVKLGYDILDMTRQLEDESNFNLKLKEDIEYYKRELFKNRVQLITLEEFYSQWTYFNSFEDYMSNKIKALQGNLETTNDTNSKLETLKELTAFLEMQKVIDNIKPYWNPSCEMEEIKANNESSEVKEELPEGTLWTGYFVDRGRDSYIQTPHSKLEISKQVAETLQLREGDQVAVTLDIYRHPSVAQVRFKFTPLDKEKTEVEEKTLLGYVDVDNATVYTDDGDFKINNSTMIKYDLLDGQPVTAKYFVSDGQKSDYAVVIKVHEFELLENKEVKRNNLKITKKIDKRNDNSKKIFNGETITVIGGEGFESYYRQDVEELGANLLWNSGFGDYNNIERLVSKSDLVIIVIPFVKHVASILAEKACEKHNVPYFLLNNSGTSSFKKLLETEVCVSLQEDNSNAI